MQKHYINCLVSLIGFLGASLFSHAQTPRAVPTAYSSSVKLNHVRSWDVVKPVQDAGSLTTITSVQTARMFTQYLDGLGRPLQTVVKEGSLATGGSAVDLVSAVEYDAFGREQFKYLPFAANTTNNISVNDGLFKLNPFEEQAVFYGDNSNGPVKSQGETFYYGQTVFEASPLNRVTKTLATGNSWIGADKGVETKYWVNTPTDAVRVWTVTDVTGDFGSYSSSSIYDAGTLYKNVTIDERGKQVIEFKDKEGKVILKKVQLSASAETTGAGSDHIGWLCTYYIYDDLNRLRAVIQPEGVKPLPAYGWDIMNYSSGVLLNEQCFRYEYDGRGRMSMKKVPGAGAVYMIYDSRDRLVMTQDANMRAAQQWLVTQYDALNRPIASYKITDPANYNNASYHQNLANSSTAYPTVGSYTNEELTRTFYDNYGWLSSNSGQSFTSSLSTLDNTHLLTPSSTTYPYPQAVTQSTALTGLVTGTKVKVLGTSTYLYTISYYDDKGKVVQMQMQNITGGTDIVTTQYAFTGLPLLTIQRQQKGGTTNAQTTTIVTKNTYDDLGRVVKVEKKQQHTNINSNAMSAYKTVLEHQYDALGRLQKKKLGTKQGGGELAKLDYEYNIRGWLLSVNKGYMNASANSDQYFAMELGYDKNPSLGSFTPQYNGNIAGALWKSEGDGAKRKYDYTYDNVNRLTGADFNQYVSGSGITASFDKTTAGLDFSVSNLSYDDNGNIKSQSQKGWKITGSDFIDQLTYTYLSNSNKLLNVLDGKNDVQTRLGDFRASSTYMTALGGTKTVAATDYVYDANGNMVKDLNKDIVTYSGGNGIEYNYLNLPSKIYVKKDGSTNKGTIEYTYDAAGTKLKKVTTELSASVPYNGTNYTTNIITTTTYIGGFVYESKSYSNASLSTLAYTDELKFFTQEEGRVRYEKATTATCTAQPNRFIYDYFIKDHLGNTRMVLTEQKEDLCYIAATSEDSRLSSEQKIYDIVDSRRIAVSTIANASSYTQFEAKVYETNGSVAGKRTGLGATLKVMSGDQVNLTCQSFYNMPASGRTDNNYMAITELLNTFVNSSGVAAKEAMTATQVYNYASNATNLSPFLQSTPQANTANAYLNWILFDEQMKFVQAGSGADPVNANGGYKLHARTVSITKNGFLYVYVSNESNCPVYFDNLNITHKPGAITEETHYYPFGLTMAGISSKAGGVLENKRKYNDGTELNSDFDINLYETDFRSLDPQVGRFWQVDPLGEISHGWSGYSFVQDNPILYNDPLGLDTVPTITLPEVTPLNPIPTLEPNSGNTNSNTSSVSNTVSPSAIHLPASGIEPNPLRPIGPGGKVVPMFEPKPWSLAAIIGLRLTLTVGSVLLPAPIGQEGIRVPNPYLVGPYAPKGPNGDDKSLTLYRGVSHNHPGFKDALNGEAWPRGIFGGHNDPAGHNIGDTYSIFTSWTLNPAVAIKFAGPFGVVLKKRIELRRTMPSPDAFNEQEVLVSGPVSGATVYPSYTQKKL